ARDSEKLADLDKILWTTTGAQLKVANNARASVVTLQRIPRIHSENQITKSALLRNGGCNGQSYVTLHYYAVQALLAWQLVYKHNFSPHNYFIWNNKDILFKNKSLFYHTWFNEGILLVRQLFNSHGYLLSYTEFLQKFRLPIRPRDFAIVIDAIPKSVTILLKNYISEGISIVNPCGNIFIGNVDVLKQKCSNKIIRNALRSVSLPAARFFWSSLFDNISWVKAWNLSNKFCINNKIKEVSYKILHRIYPAKHTLERFKLNISYTCEFCGQEKETILHIFFHCIYSRVFWKDMEFYISRKMECMIEICIFDVLFYTESERLNCKEQHIIHLFILLGKFHIHKKKWARCKPNFSHFINDFKLYVNLLEQTKNKKALKTCNALKLLKFM
uniref:Reverse transcriptase zinc-binding domain-containing protein n=1 Tax=Paramormyrops kingsleyae TaxID=1676925 RepID=A0A3B3RJW6_9TELE